MSSGPTASVLQGIFTQLQSHPATSGYTSYAYRLPQTQPPTLPPYIVFTVPMNDRDYTWGANFDIITAQFDVWSADQGIGEASTMLDAVLAAFEDQQFPVPNYLMVMCRRKNRVQLLEDPDVRWYHGIAEFEIQLET